MRSLLLTFALLQPLVFSGVALAQTFPNKPVHLICPFPPGGGVDIVTRLLAGKLSENWGLAVVVDNRAGASGTIGAAAAAKAAPDGYTLLMGGAGTMAINPALFRHLQYDPLKDLAPVSLLGTTPMVLAVHPSLPVNSVREFIGYAKANPGKVTYASAGVGSILHLTMQTFRSMTGTELVHVAYKGAAPALTDLLSGQVASMVADLPLLQPHIATGRIRALAVTTSTRSPQSPSVPTVAESGVPAFEAVFWYAVFAPAAVPSEIATKLSADIVRALNSADLQRRLADNGVNVVGSTPKELATFLGGEVTKWAKAVKESGATAD
jgi:tripartite-type tricarboxylate transporter receptor subunit TctC